MSDSAPLHKNGQGSFTVIVTAPSSPETQFQTPRSMRPPLQTPSTSSYSAESGTNAVANDGISISLAKKHLSVSPISTQHDSRFDDLLAKSDLPEPGPAYFQARRALWLTPMPNESAHTTKPLNPNLRALLEGRTEALYEESNWNGGVGRICERVLSGEPLSNKLPLQYLVCPFTCALSRQHR